MIKKSKKGLVFQVTFLGAMLGALLFTTGYATPTPRTYGPYVYPWGVRANDIVMWDLTDSYGLNTDDLNSLVDYSTRLTTINHIGNNTLGELNYTIIFQNRSYINSNMKLTFKYSNGTKEVFNKIKVSINWFDIFNTISNSTDYNTTLVGTDSQITLNIESYNRPYAVSIYTTVYTNKTFYYNSFKGKFMLLPINTLQYKSYTAQLKAEIMKIEDSPTDNDTKPDIFLTSSYVVGALGFTFDVPDLLDSGIVAWLLGRISGYGTPSLYLPSAVRIVSSLVADLLNRNISSSFRLLELFTFYNIYMLPENYNWSIITDLGNSINDLLGLQLITIVNTTEELGLYIEPSVLPTVNDMQLGNCSASIKIVWDKTNGLAKEFGIYLNYFDIKVERDIYLRLHYTTMPGDDYPNPPANVTEEGIATWVIWTMIFLIVGIAIGGTALGFSIYNYFKKAAAITIRV